MFDEGIFGVAEQFVAAVPDESHANELDHERNDDQHSIDVIAR